ncbi:hypothetical protein [Campylobacter troglodytis]|uniref:hypothetical protein n=1 Tax=Campylobacter troglodytis TaxID=654363 RepID=UPI001156E9AF|nr:hypothetical protein [Campylobacter troglodytis]TQR53193.1 hypothetical protein DMC01_11780 [Campylobacter troglodytis]
MFYKAQTNSEFRKWTMNSPLFNTRGEAIDWILTKRNICQGQEKDYKVFKSAYISLYNNDGQKVKDLIKFNFNALGMMKPLFLKKKGA